MTATNTIYTEEKCAGRLDNTTPDDNNPQHATTADRRTRRNIPALLRGIGILSVLLSLYGFFMRGWDGESDLVRFALLLGHAVVLAVVGLGCGYLLKEGKSARILLMLSLISAVAVFSILGSFIYAAYGAALDLNFSHALRWHLHSNATTIVVSLGSILILLPLLAIAFRILARGISSSMFTLFTLSNLALLLPVRNPLWIGMIAIGLGCYTLLFSLKTARQRVEVKTREGLFVVLLQFAPMATLLIRNLWLHDAVAFLYASIAAMGFIAVRQISLLLDGTSLLRQLGEKLSVLLAVFVGVCLFFSLCPFISDSLSVLTAAVACAGMIYDIAGRSHAAPHYRSMATISLVLPLLSQLWLTGNISFMLAMLATGIGMITLGYSQKQRSVLLGGLSLLMAGLTRLAASLWLDFDLNAWFAAAFLGIAAMLLASLLESRSKQLHQAWHNYRQYFAEWSY